MLIEDYVSFEIAKLLKEKGFIGPTDLVWYEKCPVSIVYTENGVSNRKLDYFYFNEFTEVRSVFDNGYIPSYISGNVYCAPTLQMAVKWLREKGFHIYSPMEIDYDEDERGHKWYHDATYYPEIRRVSDGKFMYDNGAIYTTPEQAYEVAIKYCLENLI